MEGNNNKRHKNQVSLLHMGVPRNWSRSELERWMYYSSSMTLGCRFGGAVSFRGEGPPRTRPQNGKLHRDGTDKKDGWMGDVHCCACTGPMGAEAETRTVRTCSACQSRGINNMEIHPEPREAAGESFAHRTRALVTNRRRPTVARQKLRCYV